MTLWRQLEQNKKFCTLKEGIKGIAKITKETISAQNMFHSELECIFRYGEGSTVANEICVHDGIIKQSHTSGVEPDIAGGGWCFELAFFRWAVSRREEVASPGPL